MEQILQQLVYGISIGSVYALVALGFSIIFQTTGLLSFAHHQIMMIGGLIGYTMLTRLRMPILVTVAGTMAVCAATAFAIDRFGLARIRRRGGSNLNKVVATIGIGIMINSIAILVWGAYPFSYPLAQKPVPLMIGKVAIDPKYLWTFAVSCVAMVVLQLLLKRTRYGLATRAAAADPDAAELMGIPINKMVSFSFGMSGALAGLAGILVGLLYYASFEMDTIGLKALTAAVIGGFGSLPGAVAGGILLAILETYGTVHLSGDFSNALGFAILILILLVKPSGLLGSKQREV
jgi:branched-chain amino acid transport system permease protein